MIVLLGLLFGALLIIVLALFYLLYRNNAVCDYRVKMIDEDIEKYEKLPSYDYMLLNRFWVWPLSKFLENNHD